MFERLLIPIDFSDQSLMMLDCVAQFCKHGNEEMIILNVEERGQKASSEQLARLDEIMEMLRSLNLKVRYIREEGSPADKILEKASEEGVTMIAMASSGKGMAREFLLGSTTLGVVRNITIPVFVDKFKVQEETKGKLVTRHCEQVLLAALVPIDFSSCTEFVMEALESLIDKGLGKVILFNTVDSCKYRLNDDQRFAWVKAELGKLKERLADRKCEVITHIHFGTPAYNIMEACREFGCSLVVLGTHGRSLLHEMTLGSVSEEVIRKAKVSLLIVPCKR
jgi:nucleotide-binding universal stress UspA family protein